MNTITKDKVNKILKTLPIGYYLGKNYSVTLSDGNGTNCDVMNEKITISYPQIEKYFNTDLDDKALESRIRGLLYHELSHAMLTPKKMKPNFARNVVEDCRIEKVCEDYYFGVDFMQLRKEMMIDTPNNDKYNAFLRFCKLYEGGTPELTKKLENLIDNYKELNAFSESWGDPGYYTYERHIDNLFSEFCNWFENENNNGFNEDSNNMNQNENQQSQDSNTFEMPSSSDSNEDNNNNNNDQDYSELANNNNEDNNNSNNNPSTISVMDSENEEEVNNINEVEEHDSGRSSMRGILPQFEKVNKTYENHELQNKLMQIFQTSSRKEKANSSAINSYSGLFDPRSAGRSDYKFFLQKNRQGSARAFSKVHLNLFLDRSGSFDDNVQTANEILYALTQCERACPEFDFTLITCGVGEDIMDKNNRVAVARGGTEISSRIFETFKQVQERNAVNYNVVLYDGQAYEWATRKGEDGYIGNFLAFDTPNTVMILDNTNKNVKEICKKAKVIISNAYVKELIDNLLNGLKTIFC